MQLTATQQLILVKQTATCLKRSMVLKAELCLLVVTIDLKLFNNGLMPNALNAIQEKKAGVHHKQMIYSLHHNVVSSYFLVIKVTIDFLN